MQCVYLVLHYDRKSRSIKKNFFNYASLHTVKKVIIQFYISNNTLTVYNEYN